MSSHSLTLLQFPPCILSSQSALQCQYEYQLFNRLIIRNSLQQPLSTLICKWDVQKQ